MGVYAGGRQQKVCQAQEEKKMERQTGYRVEVVQKWTGHVGRNWTDISLTMDNILHGQGSCTQVCIACGDAKLDR